MLSLLLQLFVRMHTLTTTTHLITITLSPSLVTFALRLLSDRPYTDEVCVRALFIAEGNGELPHAVRTLQMFQLKRWRGWEYPR